MSLFSHSPAARLAWKARTGVAIKSYSPTRWWSRWEVVHQLLQFYGDLEPFLRESNTSPATRQHLLDVFADNTIAEDFRMQLAATVDGGEPFVKKTYLMEGDADLSYHVYKWLQEVLVAVGHSHLPNVEAVASQIAPEDNQKRNALIQYAKDCIRPALQYFQRRFAHLDGDLHWLVQVYKAVRLCDPYFVRDTRPTVAMVDEL